MMRAMRKYGKMLCVVWLACCTAMSAYGRIGGIAEQVVNYPSVGPRGEVVTLSGKISVPMGKQPKGIILFEHYTISANSEAPSQNGTADAKNFRDDYILVIPDYIGYGATKDRIPPYLDGALTARNSVDMLLAAKPVIDSIRAGVWSDSIYVIGYSQGGAAALWTLRLLEEQYAKWFHVKACYAGSGPYDVATTYDLAVASDKIYMPLTIPMLVLGTSEAYGLNLRRADFFTPAMDKYYEDLMASKQLPVMTIALRVPVYRLSYWLTADGRDKSQPETQRLYRGFLRSSLVHYPIDNHPLFRDSICPEWKPKAPTYVFHSTKDDIVPFSNAEHLRRCWSEAPNITYDFAYYGNHFSAMLTFFSKVRKQMAQ